MCPEEGDQHGERELLLCSVIHERLNGRRMELRSTKANHVRRNLFGPVDHDHLQQDFQSMLRVSLERATQRWNFDFLQDIPAEGLLQWEQLQSHEVPIFYQTCVVGLTCKPVNEYVGKESKMHHTGKMLEKPRPAKKKAKKKSLTGMKRRQTSLSDYYTTKKGIRTDMQTPEKKIALENGASYTESTSRSFEKGSSKRMEHF